MSKTKKTDNRRIGKFYVPQHMYQNHLDNMQKFFIMIGFVPFRVEFLAYMDVFEMIGHSPLFEVSKDGEYVTEYHVFPELNEDNEMISVSVRKKFEGLDIQTH